MNRLSRSFPALATVCFLATSLPIAGCKSGSLGPTKQYSQVDLAHGGTVSGIVHFSKPAPPAIQIDMAQDPACAMSGDTMTDDYVVNGGGLGNVFVYVKSGLGNRAYATPRDPVVIDQKGCRFLPHVSGAMVGQQVEFENSDPTRHNVHMDPTANGNAAFDVSQGPKAEPVSRYFHAAETMVPLRCNNHPWMQAYLNVVDNPFFATSDDKGHFTIKGLPPGTYTLVAVHEKLGQKSATVTVGANGQVQQDFSF